MAIDSEDFLSGEAKNYVSGFPNQRVIRLSIAAVWIYEGLWCKVLGHSATHAAVVSAVPFIGPRVSPLILVALGLIECGIAAWVLWGRRMRQAAIVQTALLLAMNAGGLIWAWHLIPDPPGIILQNFAFLILIWVAARDTPHDAHE
jgi:uncharacterized membrane protein YphA (DoxX/SURF4 family)